MKKGLFILLAFLFKAAVFTASSNEFIEKATVYTPEKAYQITYLYNQNKELLMGYHKKVQNGTAWVDSEWVVWEEDGFGQKTKETARVWQTNRWRLSQEINFVYDNDGNKIEETLFVVNTSGVLTEHTRTQWIYEGGALRQVRVSEWRNGAWSPQSLSEYIYNGNQLFQVNFGKYTASTLNVISRKVFVYNHLGQLESQTLQTKIADSEEFTDESRDLFIYDSGREILKTSQKWSSEDNVWRNIVRLESEYDEYGDLTVRTLANFGQSWDNATQEIYIYDAAGNVIEKQFRSWIFRMWLNIFNESYVYDDNGNTQTAEFNRLFWTGTLAPQVASFMPLSYNNSSGVFSPAQTDLHSAYRIEVAYTDQDNVTTNNGNPPGTEAGEIAIQISMYPNPSADGYFYFNSLEVTLLSYEVYDMTGRRIVARTSNNGYIDLSHAPQGMYNAVLHTDAGTAVRKLIRK